MFTDICGSLLVCVLLCFASFLSSDFLMFSLLVVRLFIVVLTFGQLYCLLVCYIVYFFKNICVNQCLYTFKYPHLNLYYNIIVSFITENLSGFSVPAYLLL